MTEKINITDNRIEIVDDGVSAHLDFYVEIAPNKVDVYVEELRNEIARKRAERDFFALNPLPITSDYRVLRQAEYPPMSDYLDGVVKGDQAQIDKYIADCLAVKAKYPKPE